MNPSRALRLYSALILSIGVLNYNSALASLAVDPGVTIDMLQKIDQIEDDQLRQMLRAAVWPGFGEHHMDLDRPEEDLSQFEKNYKNHPLTWEQKIENVEFILDQAEDLPNLSPEELEYKDIVFGEAVVPIMDKRVNEILNTSYFVEEADQIAADKQKAMAEFYTNGGSGGDLQKIEDEFATKQISLVQAENEFKNAKVAFLKLENQHTYGRIDDETFQTETRAVVSDFEDFLKLGNAFSGEEIKAMSTRIYNDTGVTIVHEDEDGDSYLDQGGVKVKYYYWGISLFLMLIALIFGYLGLRKLNKNS